MGECPCAEVDYASNETSGGPIAAGTEAAFRRVSRVRGMEIRDGIPSDRRPELFPDKRRGTVARRAA
jgi:hypothetical protein